MDVTKDSFHRQCYQKFTNAVSVAKQKGSLAGEHPVESKRPRRPGGFSGTLFLDKCMICGSEGVKKVKGQKQNIKVIQTISACENIQLVASFKKDNNMLLAVTGEDLIAKEFKITTSATKIIRLYVVSQF